MANVQNALNSFHAWDQESGIAKAGAGKFPNPFCDIASEYVPRDLNTIFEWCEYLMMAVAPFRTVSQRVVRYFLTDIVIEGQSDNEREQYEDFLNDQLHLIQQMAEIGDDYMCFHGNTMVPTRGGVYAIRDLEGKTVDVLSEGGTYTPATFSCHGEQELMRVLFSDGRMLEATPEHQWYCVNMAGHTVQVPTTGLRPGYRIRRTPAADRPPKNADYEEGVRHGFVFGDGTVYNRKRKTPKSVANFFGEKDACVIPFFNGVGNAPRYYAKRGLTQISGLPAHWKGLPPADASASYWYGFVTGFLAADGSVDTHGCTVLTQASASVLEAVIAQLPRIGMIAGPLRSYDTETTFIRDDGNAYTCDSRMWTVTLLKRFMRDGDFLIQSHRDKFSSNATDTGYGEYITVTAVEHTDATAKVYCCVEPNSHKFVVGNGIITGNCYGNAFVSVFFPFDRFLICPKCKTTYHIETLHYKFEKSTGDFKCHCPKCDEERVMRREDRRSVDTTRVKIIRWSPKDIRLRVHPISGKIEYYLKLDSTYVSRLLDGEPFYLNDTPWDIVDACLKSDKSKKEYLFKFKDDSIYHMRCSTLAGLPVKGWAIPPILPNFKLAYYVQLLRRYDEAIALDFIIPFRILFPSNTSPQGQDALSTINMSSFIGHMQNMINSKRKNLTDIAVVPFSVGYQAMGGEARTLAPKDNIALAVDELLNSLGFPAELYKGTLSIQAFPVALRLFEKQWNSLVDGFNDFAAWLCKRLSRHFMWGEVDCTLRSVTLADDVERKAMSLQAAAGQDISKQTAYRPLGIDYAEEQKRVVEEQEMIQKLQQEAMERQQAQQQGAGGGGEGGQPAGATPGDVHEQAKALAQQLLIQTPETMRRGELIKIKHSNPTLHALVLQEMDTMRQDMARQGQAQVMQQMKQGEVIGYGPMSSLPSPIRVGLMISDQLTEYNRDDLRKIAMDIHEHVPHADDAFRFVYRRMVGWI